MQLVPISCKVCGRPFAHMDSPSKRELGAMLAGTFMAGAVAFLPKNVANELARMPIFVCGQCQPMEGQTDGSKQSARR